MITCGASWHRGGLGMMPKFMVWKLGDGSIIKKGHVMNNQKEQIFKKGTSGLQWALDIINMTCLCYPSSHMQKRVEYRGLKCNWEILFGI